MLETLLRAESTLAIELNAGAAGETVALAIILEILLGTESTLTIELKGGANGLLDVTLKMPAPGRDVVG